MNNVIGTVMLCGTTYLFDEISSSNSEFSLLKTDPKRLKNKLDIL